MKTRFLIFLVVVGLAEIYSFIAVRSALKPVPGVWRVSLMSLYILATVATWSSFILFRYLNWAAMPHLVRNIFVAFTIGFWVGKILVGSVMVIDDIRRLFMWFIGSFFSPSIKEVASDMGLGSEITRSVFLKRLALLAGGTALGGFMFGITNRYNYKIRRISLSFDNLPAAFKGMKIVQISDIHSGSFDDHRAVARGADELGKTCHEHGAEVRRQQQGRRGRRIFANRNRGPVEQRVQAVQPAFEQFVVDGTTHFSRGLLVENPASVFRRGRISGL